MPLSILNNDNVLNVGTVANDNTGDNLRTAGQKINANFEDLDSAVAEIVGMPVATVTDSTIRYDGSVYVSTDGLKVDSIGNTTVSGTLDVTGNITVVTGNITVGGYDVSTMGSKLAGIEPGATADQTDSEIKVAYENNSNTNAFTDDEKSKLNGIEENATFGVPSGTKQLFVQSVAPVGWTKDTTHNNKALRVVSGTAGSGGSDAFTTTFGSGKTTASHTLTIDEIPSHSHSITIRSNGSSSGTLISSTSIQQDTRTKTTGATGGDQGHSHNLSGFDLQYVDVIIATRD